MMRRTVQFAFSVAALVLLLAVSLVRPGGAQLVNDEAVGRLTIGGSIGPQMTAMDDINDNISVVNRFLQRDLIERVGKVKTSVSTGLDVRYRLGRTPPEDPEETTSWKDRVSLGFAWGGLNADTGINVGSATVRLFTRTTTYTPYVLYHLPFLETVAQRSQLYVGAGAIFMRNGYLEWKVRDRTRNNFLVDGDIAELTGSGTAEASGTGFLLMTGASYQLSTRFSVAVDMGYRQARMSNVKITRGTTPTEGTATEPWNIERFPGGEDDIIREPGDWAIIDFFLRDPGARFDGKNRQDPQEDGGCEGCPLYYTGGPIDVDFSGPFTQFSFRVHF